MRCVRRQLPWAWLAAQVRYSWAEDATSEGKALNSLSPVAEGLHCRATDDKGHAHGLAPHGPRKWKQNAPGVCCRTWNQTAVSSSGGLPTVPFFCLRAILGRLLQGPAIKNWSAILQGASGGSVSSELYFKCSVLFLDLNKLGVFHWRRPALRCEEWFRPRGFSY